MVISPSVVTSSAFYKLTLKEEWKRKEWKRSTVVISVFGFTYFQKIEQMIHLNSQSWKKWSPTLGNLIKINILLVLMETCMFNLKSS